MAVDSSSITLSDYALLSNDPLVQYISNSMLMLGDVRQDIPLEIDPTMVKMGIRWIDGSNTSDNWRKLNEETTITKSIPSPWQEQAYIKNGGFDVDTFITADRNQIQEPFAAQLQKWLMDSTYHFNDKFINNNQITGDADCFNGLRFRLDNPTDYGIPTEMKLTAAATDVSAGSNMPKLFSYVDRMLIRMGRPEGDGVVIYTNEDLKVLIDFGLKLAGTSGGFRTVTDSFDRSITKYKNATLRVVGRKADQTTQIITSTEDTTGLDASSTYSSMYFVKYGQDAFRGWQFRGLEQSIIGPYMLPGGTQERLVIDWAVGLLQEDVRSVGRLYNIKVA